MSQISYRIKYSKKTQILTHLKNCSENFIPRLTSYVEIEDYAKKIFINAITFEAWIDEKLVGLIAVYVNNDNSIGFITSVSIENAYQGKGIAKNLLDLCLDFARLKQLIRIDLEVYRINEKAVKFYEKYGFTCIEKNMERYKMSYKIC